MFIKSFIFDKGQFQQVKNSIFYNGNPFNCFIKTSGKLDEKEVLDFIKENVLKIVEHFQFKHKEVNSVYSNLHHIVVCTENLNCFSFRLTLKSSKSIEVEVDHIKCDAIEDATFKNLTILNLYKTQPIEDEIIDAKSVLENLYQKNLDKFEIFSETKMANYLNVPNLNSLKNKLNLNEKSSLWFILYDIQQPFNKKIKYCLIFSMENNTLSINAIYPYICFLDEFEEFFVLKETISSLNKEETKDIDLFKEQCISFIEEALKKEGFHLCEVNNDEILFYSFKFKQTLRFLISLNEDMTYSIEIRN